jgi:hypothetical protein
MQSEAGWDWLSTNYQIRYIDLFLYEIALRESIIKIQEAKFSKKIPVWLNWLCMRLNKSSKWLIFWETLKVVRILVGLLLGTVDGRSIHYY